MEKRILYQVGRFWVSAEIFGTGRLRPKSHGFSLWEVTTTHSKQIGTYGGGDKYYRMACDEADRRHKADTLVTSK